mmetsp:Transcript_16948/g.57895  ORF Transcript_16948/g.57895 Transcript_16948/m.57895 type:complete len:392 (-) Transcript_16948:377-1552(-)
MISTSSPAACANRTSSEYAPTRILASCHIFSPTSASFSARSSATRELVTASVTLRTVLAASCASSALAIRLWSSCAHICSWSAAAYASVGSGGVRHTWLRKTQATVLNRRSDFEFSTSSALRAFSDSLVASRIASRARVAVRWGSTSLRYPRSFSPLVSRCEASTRSSLPSFRSPPMFATGVWCALCSRALSHVCSVTTGLGPLIMVHALSSPANAGRKLGLAPVRFACERTMSAHSPAVAVSAAPYAETSALSLSFSASSASWSTTRRLSRSISSSSSATLSCSDSMVTPLESASAWDSSRWLSVFTSCLPRCLLSRSSSSHRSCRTSALFIHTACFHASSARALSIMIHFLSTRFIRARCSRRCFASTHHALNAALRLAPNIFAIVRVM